MPSSSLAQSENAPIVHSADGFFAELRRKRVHLGLDPEFSSLQTLCTVPQQAQLATMREHIDQFFWGRGNEVLEKLLRKAQEFGATDLIAMFVGLRGFVGRLLTGQFLSYQGEGMIPQPGMLREMLGMVNEGRAEDLGVYLEQHITEMDGHFFMSISESLRHSRAIGAEGNLMVLPSIGRVVAHARLRHGLPCTFAILFEP